MLEMTIIQRHLKNWLRTRSTLEFLGLWEEIKEVLIKSFDKHRTNGKVLIMFVVSLSSHECNQLIQSFLNYPNLKGVEFSAFKSEAGTKEVQEK